MSRVKRQGLCPLFTRPAEVSHQNSFSESLIQFCIYPPSGRAGAGESDLQEHERCGTLSFVQRSTSVLTLFRVRKPRSSRMPRRRQDYCHRAVLMPVVLLQIFEEAMKDRQSGRRTLARAARTCTAWNGPAYDISWRDTNLVLALQVLAPMTMIEEEDFEELRPQHKLRYVSLSYTFGCYSKSNRNLIRDHLFYSTSLVLSHCSTGSVSKASPSECVHCMQKTSIPTSPALISARRSCKSSVIRNPPATKARYSRGS